MLEAVAYEEEQFRGAHLRLDIYGDAVACSVSVNMHLVVGSIGILFAPRFNDAALQDPIVFQWHRAIPP